MRAFPFADSVTVESKFCTGCEQDLPVEEFSRNRSRPDGLQNYCKSCASRASQRSKRNSKKKTAHESRLRRLTLYGLTPEDYERMVFDQNNQCPICRRDMAQPQIDYDPTTGELRGLLCSDCRSGLTLFQNDLELIYRLSSYLEAYKSDNTPE